MNQSRWRGVMAVTAVAVVSACMAAAQVAPRARGAAPAPKAPPAPPAVATVGTLRILKPELDQRVEQAMADYRSRSGSQMPPEILTMLRRQVLESLMRRDLLVLEARRRGMVGDVREAEAQVKQDPFFHPNGKFDSTRYNMVRQQNPAMLARAVQEIQQTLAARDLMEKLQKERGATPAAIRASARRALMRASIDYLALRRADFHGGFPEPREDEVLAYYAAHAADFVRPQRASLSVVFVNQPRLADSLARVPSAVEAWSARMKVRADSVVAAVKAGATLEAASADLGAPRPTDVVPGNFPGYWRGDEAGKARVFAAAPGTVLPEPVASSSGWLVVRVDRVQPAHTATLREAARDVRTRMRGDRARDYENQQLHTLYESLKDSLRTVGYRLRFGSVDAATFAAGEPTAQDLDRYYRAHQADYSSFSDEGGGVVSKSFESVREDVRTRWLQENRQEQARALCEKVAALWGRGRRDATLEQRLKVREVGPLPLGAAVDTGSAAQTLADTLALRNGALGAGLARTPAGWIAFDVLEAVPGFLPGFEQVKPLLLERRSAERTRADEAGARQLFESSPGEFIGGAAVHYSRAMFARVNPLKVELTRAEVERYYREHMEKFSAPELVGASHILISPRDTSAAADREAKARADSLLERLRAGEDFAEMARKVSDDPATRENGGSLDLFRRGTMLPELESAAFAMRPGDLSAAPVRTKVGYHILKVTQHEPLYTQPLVHVYSNVSSMAAEEKGDSLAKASADSVLRRVHNAAEARAAARQLGLTVIANEHVIGQDERAPGDLVPYFRRIETLAPGVVVPAIQSFRGMGYALTWIDSLSAPRTLDWISARDHAVELYRQGAGLRALEAKQAELDSLFRAGWSFDSLGVLWGGLEHAEGFAPGAQLRGLNADPKLDSLVFGPTGEDGMKPGQLSDWITLVPGRVRILLKGLVPPDEVAVTTRTQAQGRVALDRALSGYFDDLKKRYGTRILDPTLRDVSLPPITPAPR